MTNEFDKEEAPSNKQRRAIIGGGLTALLASWPAAPRRANAQQVVPPGAQTVAPNDPFILLLKGIYKPVTNGPDLGLSGVNLNDGSYSVTQIYPVFGIGDAGGQANQSRPIGNFYVQSPPGVLCAYQLPRGAIAMQFTSGGFTPHSDGMGGNFLEATFELAILQATGIYSAFKTGHNHMVDRLHQLANGELDEFCFCNISTYPFP